MRVQRGCSEGAYTNLQRLEVVQGLLQIPLVADQALVRDILTHIGCLHKLLQNSLLGYHGLLLLLLGRRQVSRRPRRGRPASGTALRLPSFVFVLSRYRSQVKLLVLNRHWELVSSMQQAGAGHGQGTGTLELCSAAANLKQKCQD